MTSQAKKIGPYQVVELKRPDAGLKTIALSVRISADLKRRMDECCETGPYHVSQTTLVQRGIELAMKEIAILRASIVDDQLTKEQRR